MKIAPFLTMILLLLFSSFAFADEGAEAMKAINDANSAYDKGEFREALKHYRKAYLITEDSRVLYRIGLTFENLANYQRAREHLELYLLSEPTSKYVGRVKKKVENLRKLEQTLQADVRIISDPEGARVFTADSPGRAIGLTPLRIPVGPGNHAFEVKLDGFEDATVSVNVPAGESIEETVELVESEAPIEEEPEVIVEKPKIETEVTPEIDEKEPSIYDGRLTKVDVSPPSGVAFLLWLAFPVGAGIGLAGTILLATDGRGGPAFMLVGTTVALTSGYFLWFHNWTAALPDVDSSSPPTAGFGFRF